MTVKIIFCLFTRYRFTIQSKKEVKDEKARY